MITGDGKETAAAIAEMLGLQTDRKVLLSGAEVDRMNDVELQRIADSVSLNSYTIIPYYIRLNSPFLCDISSYRKVYFYYITFCVLRLLITFSIRCKITLARSLT